MAALVAARSTNLGTSRGMHACMAGCAHYGCSRITWRLQQKPCLREVGLEELLHQPVLDRAALRARERDEAVRVEGVAGQPVHGVVQALLLEGLLDASGDAVRCIRQALG